MSRVSRFVIVMWLDVALCRDIFSFMLCHVYVRDFELFNVQLFNNHSKIHVWLWIWCQYHDFCFSFHFQLCTLAIWFHVQLWLPYKTATFTHLHCIVNYTCYITVTITQPQRVHWLGNTLVTVCFTALQLLSIRLLYRLRGLLCLICGFSQLHKMLGPGGAARSHTHAALA